jgi:hypothetical protein
MPRNRNPWIFASALAIKFMAALEGTIVATAMPTIVGSLGGFDLFSWVFSAYLLAQAITIPVYGRLADMYGRKRVLFLGIGLFLSGSLLSGFAWSIPSLIAFRVVQGLGAGALIPVAQTIIGDIYTGECRARIQGYVSSVFGRHHAWDRSPRTDPKASPPHRLHWRRVDGSQHGYAEVCARAGGYSQQHCNRWFDRHLGVFARDAVDPRAQSTRTNAPDRAVPQSPCRCRQCHLSREWHDIDRRHCISAGLHARRHENDAASRGRSPRCDVRSLADRRLCREPTYVALILPCQRNDRWARARRWVLGDDCAWSHGCPGMAHCRGAADGVRLGITNICFVVAVQSAVDLSQRGSATSSLSLTRIVGQSLGAAVFGGMLNVGLAEFTADKTDIVAQMMQPGLRQGLDGAMEAFTHSLHNVYLVNGLLALVVLAVIRSLPSGLKLVQRSGDR